MAIRVAINGFGRIGRCVFRAVRGRTDVTIVAVNDLADAASLAHMLKYDSIMGRYPGPVTVDGSNFVADGKAVRVLAEKDPAKLPWKEMEVDVAIESTGIFTGRAQCEAHLAAGARKVVLTVPPKEPLDATIVLGVNEHMLKPEHKLVSNASCTTNCLAPMAKIVHELFGIRHGLMTTVHAYTNDQRIHDLLHKDLRRARAAAVSIIPTTTGAAKAVGLVLPELKGKLDGFAMRVPTPNVSLVDLVVLTEKSTTTEEVNASLKKAADGPLKGILEYCADELVSIDFRANPHSSIVDAGFTKVIDGNLIKLTLWYDNEWGYSCRVRDLINFIAKKL